MQNKIKKIIMFIVLLSFVDNFAYCSESVQNESEISYDIPSGSRDKTVQHRHIHKHYQTDKSRDRDVQIIHHHHHHHHQHHHHHHKHNHQTKQLLTSPQESNDGSVAKIAEQPSPGTPFQGQQIDNQAQPPQTVINAGQSIDNQNTPNQNILPANKDQEVHESAVGVANNIAVLTR